MLKKIGENNKIKYLLMNTNKTENEAQSDLWTRAFEEDLEVGSNAGGGNTKSLFDEGPPGEINMQEDASSSAVWTALKDKSEEYYGIVDNWIKDSRRGEKGVIEEIEEGGNITNIMMI